MSFTNRQKALLDNLYQHAEMTYYGAPAYSKHCFEHLLGIYLQFGSYQAFTQAIDQYNGDSVKRFQDFASEMLKIGLADDDFRLKELLPYLAAEVRQSPTGALAETLSSQAKCPIPFIAPPLLDAKGVARFDVELYLDVYQEPLRRQITNAMLHVIVAIPEACILNAIKKATPERFDVFAYPLKQAYFTSLALPYEDDFRQALLGTNVGVEELMFRLKYILKQPAEAAGGDFSGQASSFSRLLDERISQDGLEPSIFSGVGEWLLMDLGKLGSDSRNMVETIAAISREIERKGICFEQEVIMGCARRIGGTAKLSLFEPDRLTPWKSGITQINQAHRNDLYQEDYAEETASFCASILASNDLQIETTRVKALCGMLPYAMRADEGAAQLIRALLGHVDHDALDTSEFCDLEIMGLYQHTGETKALAKIRSTSIIDRIFGHDLGL